MQMSQRGSSQSVSTICYSSKGATRMIRGWQVVLYSKMQYSSLYRSARLGICLRKKGNGFTIDQSIIIIIF